VTSEILTRAAAKGARPPEAGSAAAREDTSLASDIARRLEDDILHGRLRPGQRLDERDLSDRYGVSRTPVREALQRLSASGLAEARGRQGLQVAQLSVADLLDALSVVSVLEALAAGQAARRVQPEQRRLLEAAHRSCGEAAGRGDHDGFYDANIAFHDAIAAASQNRILQEEIRRLSLKTAPYRRAITFQPGRMHDSLPQHAAVLEAILRNDAAAAGERMTAHLSMLSEGIADLLRFVQASEFGSLFSDEA
jgi:DNA-binding GntR family transcriptional regulator